MIANLKEVGKRSSKGQQPIYSIVLRYIYILYGLYIHRWQNVYEHQHQREIRAKHQIWRPISREAIETLTNCTSHGTLKSQYKIE